jgi:acetyl esterase/lipase
MPTRTAVAALLLCAWALGAGAEERPDIAVDADGTITDPVLSVPLSDFLSPGAKHAWVERLRQPSPFTGPIKLEEIAKATEDAAKILLDRWIEIYPSSIEETTIDGVHAFVVTPHSGVDRRNAHRVLIAAHQGGFRFGGTNSALLEAVPLAGRGRVKVIAVDYRKAPQFAYPAASEDMERVYRYVLKSFKPKNVGIYGCSAGGTLVAESLVRFQQQSLPRPGAAGIMCSGAMKNFWFGGDSYSVSAILNGKQPPKPDPGPYFTGANMEDAAVTPGLHPDVLQKFPPTLLVTGTRDIAMSNVLMTHAALLEAGVDARLFVQEGLGHGHFFFFPGTPEAATAYDVIWNFFDAQLGR